MQHSEADVKENSEQARSPSSTLHAAVARRLGLGGTCLTSTVDENSNEFVTNDDNSGIPDISEDGSSTSNESNESLTPPTLEEFTKYDICKRFNVLEKLGEGGFGAVFKAEHKTDRNLYALKVIPLLPSEEEAQIREAQILCKLYHANVVRYHTSEIVDTGENLGENDDDGDSELDDEEATGFQNFNEIDDDDILFGDTDDDVDNNNSSNDDASFVESNNSYQEAAAEAIVTGQNKCLVIQMEFCSSTLKQSIKSYSFTNETRMKALKEILEGIGYVHSEGIMHRDLNPNNIFFTSNGIIKIGDFGSSRWAVQHSGGSGSRQNSKKFTGYIGTKPYCAPELETGRYDKRVDLYSLGFIIFELWYPFGTNTTEQEKMPIFKGLRSREVKLPEDFDAVMGHIVRGLLKHNPDHRLTLDEVFAILKNPEEGACAKSTEESAKIYGKIQVETSDQLGEYVHKNKRTLEVIPQPHEPVSMENTTDMSDVNQNCSSVPQGRKELDKKFHSLNIEVEKGLMENISIQQQQLDQWRLQSSVSQEDCVKMIEGSKKVRRSIEDQKKILLPHNPDELTPDTETTVCQPTEDTQVSSRTQPRDVYQMAIGSRNAEIPSMSAFSKREQ